MNKQWVAMTMAGTLAVGTAVTALAAADADTKYKTTVIMVGMAEGKMGQMMDILTEEQQGWMEVASDSGNDEQTRKAALDLLVEASVITQEYADDMLANPKNISHDTVIKIDTSSWTNEQKALLETAIDDSSDMTARKTALNALVEDGVVTQEDAALLLEGSDTDMGIMIRGMLDTSSWTDEQKALYETAVDPKTETTERQSALDALVKEGVLLQTTADIMLEGHTVAQNKLFGIDVSGWTETQRALLEAAINPKNDEAMCEAALSSLKDENLLSSEQAETVLGHRRTREKIQHMTKEQKSSFIIALNPYNDEETRRAAADSLVEEGVFTQEEADELLTQVMTAEAPETDDIDRTSEETGGIAAAG